MKEIDIYSSDFHTQSLLRKLRGAQVLGSSKFSTFRISELSRDSYHCHLCLLARGLGPGLGGVHAVHGHGSEAPVVARVLAPGRPPRPARAHDGRGHAVLRPEICTNDRVREGGVTTIFRQLCAVFSASEHRAPPAATHRELARDREFK